MNSFKHTVERVHGITPDTFHKRYLLGFGQPVIVGGELDTCLARSKWSFDFFKSNYGSSDVVPQTFLDTTLVQRRMKLRDYIDYIEAHVDASQGACIDSPAGLARGASVLSRAVPLYLYWNAFSQHPELQEQFVLSPRFVEDWLPFLPGHFHKVLNKVRNYFSAGLLIGPKGSMSRLHCDLLHTHAYLAQILGRKKCVLFSPEDSPMVYDGLVDPDRPDFERFPLFRQATAFECILEPGEVLFIPSRWWHQVVNIEKSLAVNYNFFNRANFAAYLTDLLRDLPAVVEKLQASPNSAAALGINWVSRGFDYPSSPKKSDLDGDLIWWRESPSIHTAVTVWGGETDLRNLGLDGLEQENEIIFQLYDAAGKPLTRWTERARPGVPITVDSRNHPNIVEEGVLAVFSTASHAPTPKNRRLYSMVDWYSGDGDLVSLHSDHSLARRTKPIEFTEIVFLETGELQNFLVLINGAEPQRPDSVALQVRNHRGEFRSAVYSGAMVPFSLHKLSLSELFPDLREFCDGKHATLEGRFEATNLFSRPYVMTEGRHMAGYHGGDRYQWNALPRFMYKALQHGEVTPMVAIHSGAMTTTVNLLNSHGDLDEDFWVDAQLYDESGRQVANRKKWLLAPRYGLARGDVKDLLGENGRTFTGHIALNFSDEDKLFYPRRLQALLEYRTPVSTARVMAWSDIWNARPAVQTLRDQLAGFFDMNTLYGKRYLGGPEVRYRSHYRVWFRPPIRSFIAVTNCGVAEDYAETVSYTIRLFNARGETPMSYRGTLAPHATNFLRIDGFFPSVGEFLSPQGLGLASVESAADLAVMHFSEHQDSGVVSAEHFLASVNYQDGEYYTSCGA